jgi:sugar lactone lactonase YvrE
MRVYASVASRIYFTDFFQTTGSVYELIGSASTPIFTFSGTLSGNRAYHSAFDRRTSKLYVSNSNQFKLFAVNSATGAASDVFTHTTFLRDVAFDPAGNLYFSEATGAAADGKIYRLNLTSGTATVFYNVVRSSIGGFWAGDFTFAPDGHLYISTGNVVGGRVYRIDDPAAASSPVSVYSIAAESVTGIAFDRYGQFYYSNWDSTAGHIYQLQLSTGTRTLIFSAPGAGIWDVSFR